MSLVFVVCDYYYKILILLKTSKARSVHLHITELKLLHPETTNN